jgi:hypothetical protein
MNGLPERPSDPGGDTLPDLPAAADQEGSDFGRIERQVRRRNAARRAREGFAEVAKEVPELVFEFIQGLLP